MQIINHDELVDDIVEGLANYLDIDMEHARHYVDDNMINDVYDAIWQAESDIIVYYAERINNAKVQS